MKIAILGGCGFIGSSLAEALVARGASVRIFDRRDVDRSRIAGIADSVEFIAGDIGNEAEVAAALNGADIAAHLACSTIPATSNADFVYDIETNLLATVRMLGQAVESGVRRVVFASSGGTVYGPTDVSPIPEDHPTMPVSSYGIHKLAIEKYLALHERTTGLEWVAIRASNPFGRRQRPDHAQGAVAVFADRIKRGQEITIWGDGTVVRDYIHISDLVEAYVKVIETDPSSKVYNIGSGVGTSLNDLVALMAKVSGIEPRVKYEEGRKIDAPVNVLDCSRAGRELGWEAKVSLADGLAEFFREG